MLVVSDSSPLNILIRINQIKILPSLFGCVIVPTSVADEMTRAATPQVVKDWMKSPPIWFSIQTPTSQIAATELRHRGERDAISLAQEIHADALLLDEEKPRLQASALGILVIGTVGILQRAADKQLIPDLRIVFEELRKTNFRVSDKILADSLAQHLAYKRSRQ